MTKRMGEFEKRPPVKEAVPVPLERRKPIGWMVATAILGIIAVGAISYIIVDKMESKKTRRTTSSRGWADASERGCVNKDQEHEEDRASDSENNESKRELEQEKPINVPVNGFRKKEDYDGLLENVSIALRNKISKDDAIELDKNDKGPLIKIDDGLYTTLDYGRSLSIDPVYSGSIKDELRDDDWDNIVGSILMKYGFKQGVAIGRYNKSYTDDNGSICVVGINGDFSMDCGHQTWLSEEKKALIKAIWPDYKAKTKNTMVVLDAKADGVKNSSVAGYQKLTASEHYLYGIGGAAALFYRKDGGTWRYFASVQAVISCNSYTGDAIKAFAGDDCYDETTRKKRKVGQ